MKHSIHLFLLLAAMLAGPAAFAQWGAPYSNSWIRYDQPYVKIGISKKGVYKLPFSSLPKAFPLNAPEQIQLWHRGKEVAILGIANNEITFYAVPNDGASDSLLYRPMSSRINPYSSMYSDESAYFLTVGKNVGSRAKVVAQPTDEAVTALSYHTEVSTKLYQQEYSLSTKTAINPGLINSFFELGASKTGEVCKKDSQIVINFKLSDWVAVAQKPMMKLLIHGRSKNHRKVEVRIGKTKNALRLVTALDNSGFEATEYQFEMKAEDIDSHGNGTLTLRSNAGDTQERFSIAYYTIQFPQILNFASQGTKEVKLEPATQKWSRIALKSAAASWTFIDISEPDKPVLLKRVGESLMVPRQPGRSQTILATTEVNTVALQKVREVQFKAHSPQAGNYMIITTESLREGAAAFAGYRASAVGGGFKPLIADIQDIYNQFNYGEPSPVAIKKFMAYMLSSGTKDKYLFLIGKSITISEKMVRELPGEVPAIGYPGSDMLLVEGIAGAPANFPAIPVGRLSALTNQTILDYLQKVKAYEQEQLKEQGWRKKVLHISGGKSTSEIIQLRDHLQGLEPMVMKGSMGGVVKPFIKQTAGIEVESVDITKDVNEGVGMITFLGHGATHTTDPDIGYARDAARGYHNLNKYPILFFNGCGVGNVFVNRFNANPSNPRASDRITLSLDWLVAPDRGAIAVFANSHESYVSPGVAYLQVLYRYLFDDPESAGMPLGKVQLKVAHDILSKNPDRFNIAYVHQSLLQGDPALRGMNFAKPDYAVEADKSISLRAGTSGKTMDEADSLRIGVQIANNGLFVEEQTIPVLVSWADKTGMQNKQLQVRAFPYLKDIEFAILNTKSIHSIKVRIDPDGTIQELKRDNNATELFIDWGMIRDRPQFSGKDLEDHVPPMLTVKMNRRLPSQNEVLSPDPEISIHLSDDRQLGIDSTLVDIFIKNCPDDECEFTRVNYAKGITLTLIDARELAFLYQSKLPPGKYEMLVNAKDRAGNVLSSPYRMRFEIRKPEEMRHKLVVSPNPATNFVRFELQNARSLRLKTIQYLIYDQRGWLVDSQLFTVAHADSSLEWYWFRTGRNAGLYHYKVILTGESGEPIGTSTGKLIFVH